MKTINQNFKAIVDKLLADGNRITPIAKAMGYTTTQQIYNSMSGKSAMTSRALQKFVEAFKVNPNYLFTGNGSMFTENTDDDNVGYVIYNNDIKGYLGPAECFMVKLKSATIYGDKIHADSVLFNFSTKYCDNPYGQNLKVIPVSIQLLKEE